MLRRSVENGFFPHSYMASDPLLESLHGKQGFAEIMQLVENRQASFKGQFFSLCLSIANGRRLTFDHAGINGRSSARYVLEVELIARDLHDHETLIGI
jgi:hypothetical protein